jgi:endonuclease I
MKKTYLLVLLCSLLSTQTAWAQTAGTGTYYQKANGKKGSELKTAMFNIIKNPNVVDYDSLWYAYNISDKRVLNGEEIIWDMYSTISRYPLYTYPHGTGAGNTEGVKGIQREHSLVKKWFNPEDAPASGTKTYADVRPMYSDLVHVIPTDAVCNNNRNDLCYGEIGDPNNVDWQSAEGFSKKSKQGGCSTPGWAEQTENAAKKRVYEPNDEYKGDLARIYFYMVMCYEPGYLTWTPVRDESYKKTGEAVTLNGKHCGTWTSDMFNVEETEEGTDAYQPFAPWAFDMLIRWSKEDPVSQKEKDRNEIVWQLQGNRNPFVDYPGLEDYIWGDKKEVAFDYGGEVADCGMSDNCDIALNRQLFGVDWSATDNMCDYWTRTPLTIEKSGITFTYSYGMEGKILYADDNELRLYNYNTLTLTAHNNEITKVEFTIPGSNHDNKTLVATVGEVNDNVWTGNAEEVTFASNYVSSTKAGGVSKHYYLELSNVKVTVANPSGIEQMENERCNDDRIFNLAGVQMDGKQLPAGIYIKNGRKMIIK